MLHLWRSWPPVPGLWPRYDRPLAPGTDAPPALPRGYPSKRATGLLTIDELDERLTVYHDDDRWRRITLPMLRELGARKVAEAVGISERRARDLLKGRAMPHVKHRMTMDYYSSIFDTDSMGTPVSAANRRLR